MNKNPDRLSITLGAHRLAYLQAEAARRDIRIAELIRRIIDHHREQRERRIVDENHAA